MVLKTDNAIDKEWVNLIVAAKKLNITPDEIRRFFEEAASKNQNK